MQAKVVQNAKGVLAIIDPVQVRAAKDENLTVKDKPVLITRGHDTSQTVGIIYREFSRREDKTGQRFRFSRSKRGLIEIDPIWHNEVRITPSAFTEYVKSWFQFCELIQTAALGEVLILTSELPKMAVSLWQQNRYVTENAALFEIVD